MRNSSTFKQLLAGYIQALTFCALDDDGNPVSEPAISAAVTEAASKHVEQFLCELLDIMLLDGTQLINGVDPEQIGHDLYLTGAGHGSGFWDKPELYGHLNADMLTEMVSVKKYSFETYVEDNTIYM